MSGCSLQDIKRDALFEASIIFKGNAKSITFKDNVATISYGSQYQVKTYNQAFEMAKRKLADVENWASKKFGEKFKYGWGKVDDSLSDKIRVSLTFPSNLYQAYSIKKNETSGRDLAYYNGEEQLMQQEEGFYQLDTPIKQGVSELFESNPELANAVYSKILTNSGLSAENLLSLLLKDNLIEKQCS